jgi:hypothetical protein
MNLSMLKLQIIDKSDQGDILFYSPREFPVSNIKGRLEDEISSAAHRF